MLQQLGLAELCWPHLAHSGVSASACGDSAAVRVVGVRPSATAGASASSVMKRIAHSQSVAVAFWRIMGESA